MALITVVPPCTKKPMPSAPNPDCSAISMASSTPIDWSSTVVRLFEKTTAPLASSYEIRSVKVPPTSVATRIMQLHSWPPLLLSSVNAFRIFGRDQSALDVALNRGGVSVRRRSPTAAAARHDLDPIAPANWPGRGSSELQDASIAAGDLEIVDRPRLAAIHRPRRRNRPSKAAIHFGALGQHPILSHQTVSAAKAAGTDATFDIEAVALN